MTILPLAYLPSVEWFAHAVREECLIDLGEHFVKRSERNRCRILTANGPMELTVQVVRANRPRIPMRDVRIDYSKRWPHQHWVSLVSAYRGSPYFDHYAPRFEAIYATPFERLAELNLALAGLCAELLGTKLPRCSATYVEAAPDDVDLRPKRREGATFTAAPYVQVFSDRMPFVTNLSIADLLFCEGPRSRAILTQCRW